VTRQPGERGSVSEIAAKTAVESHEVEQAPLVVIETLATGAPESIFRRRLRKFRRIKRGYYSFVLITVAYVI